MKKAHLLAGTVLLVTACHESAQPAATEATSTPATPPPALAFPRDGVGIVTPLPDPLKADAAGHATAIDDVASPYQGTGFYGNAHTGPDPSSAANAVPCARGDLADGAA